LCQVPTAVGLITKTMKKCTPTGRITFLPFR
jgi:hypothetical protein